jgi:DNA-binding NarL/FixJ family response regulator
MPEMSGFLATRLLRQRRPTPRVLMFSDARTRQDLAEAVDAGAVGYLLKDGDLGTLVAAIRTVAAGGTAWPGGDFGVHGGLVSMSRTGTEGRLPP